MFDIFVVCERVKQREGEDTYWDSIMKFNPINERVVSWFELKKERRLGVVRGDGRYFYIIEGGVGMLLAG